MADKNNIADENYLDNLLKAITGEGGDTSEKISDDELDFDSAIRADGSEEAFLSDFEKDPVAVSAMMGTWGNSW